jgi:hypothetical protein
MDGGASRGPWVDDSTFLAESHECAQTLELCGKHTASEWRQAIVAAALVVAVVAPAARLVDQLVVLEAADGAIEISRLERDLAVRVRENILPDSVAVSLTGGEHREDDDFDGFEREQRLWGRAIGHDSSGRFC